MAAAYQKRKQVISLAVCLLDDDSSDSEEDEMELGLGLDLRTSSAISVVTSMKPEKHDRHRQSGYAEIVVSRFRLDEFQTFFRVSRSSVDILLNWIRSTCRDEGIAGIVDREATGGKPQIPLDQRVLLLLWYMSSQDKYSSLADRFGLSESTACDSVRILLNFIAEHLLEKLVTWPSQEEMTEMASMYNELKHFDGIVGMIDGSHIPIKQPADRGTDYYNRKEFYSVVLQAVVREDMRFTNVYTGWPGKVHDARIFKNSPLFQKGLQLCGDRHILGDSGYPNLTWLLVPFRDDGHLTPAQKKYNKTHASIRSVVERAFGLLKGRFTRLRFIDQRHIKTIVTTILSACVLHNICILNHDDFQDILVEENIVEPDPQIVEEFDVNAQEQAAHKRLAIARSLLHH